MMAEEFLGWISGELMALTISDADFRGRGRRKIGRGMMAEEFFAWISHGLLKQVLGYADYLRTLSESNYSR